MMNAAIGAAIGAVAWIIWSMNYDKRMAPDSYQYAAIAKGQRVVAPFWMRWLVPFVLRERGYLWEAMTLVCTMTLHACVAFAYGPRAALLLAPMHLISWNIKVPVQVDLAALALVSLALVVQHPVALIILGIYAGAVRENAPIMAAVAAWSPWPLVGLVGILPGLRWRRRIDPTVDKNPWLVQPWQTTFASKRLLWMNPRIMLFPWGLALPLALTQGLTLRLALALAVAYAPLLRASDNARLYLWALPVVLGYAVQAPISEAWWPAILLAHGAMTVYACEVTHYSKGGIQLS